ncbi:MAG: glycosyltransferase family 9 protein [Nitrosomonadales bacterium]|nr:glycosyltransferase family 9 protein [Nitrosomonadales bacterium]
MSQPKKILFITLSNIGDVVLTTPVLIRLAQIYKNAYFDVVGDQRSEMLFKHCPFINKFYRKDKSKGFIGVLNLVRRIRANHYDLAVDLRSDGLLYLIRADKKFNKVKNNNIHSAEKHFLSIKQPTNLMPKPEIWLNKQEKIDARKLIPKGYKRILALGIGANSEHKIWPAQFFAELASMLQKNFDFILIVGDSRDNKFVPIFKEAYGGEFLNLCGKLDLLTTAAVIKNSELFVGNDSGLGHIASAVQTKTFTIFGPGEPHRYRPWGEESYWVQDKQKIIQEIKPALVFKKVMDAFGYDDEQ